MVTVICIILAFHSLYLKKYRLCTSWRSTGLGRNNKFLKGVLSICNIAAEAAFP